MSTCWPSGIPRHLEYPAVGVGELLAAACRRFSDHVAVEDGDEELPYAGLLSEASAWARALRADGLGPGSLVLLHLPNGRDFVVAYLGVQLSGAAISPANPLQPATALHDQVVEGGCAAIITHPDHAATAIEAAAGTQVRRIVVVPGSAAAPATCEAPADGSLVDRAAYLNGGSTEPPEAPEMPASPEDLAHLAFTGGTTGVSKGVRVLNRNVVANVVQAVAWRAAHAVAVEDGKLCLTPLGRDDTALPLGEGVTIVAGPMYHAQALINTLFMLLTGARIVIMGRFDPDRMLEVIETRRATYINGSPAMWHALIGCASAGRRDLGSLQAVSSGAAPIDRETMRALRGLFPAAMLNEGWGLTEATCLVTATPAFHGARRKLGSVGQPICDTLLEVRAADGTVVGLGEHGELWVKGPQVTAGYLGRDDLTDEQYVDGWLRTGDIGYVDQEGFVFISDRLKDMLIYKGYNVYPRELEELIVRFPGVDAAAVVGRPDPGAGQLPVAFVVARPGSTVDGAALQAYVAEHVVPYKKLREVHLVDRLPTNPAGKILKAELRARL